MSTLTPYTSVRRAELAAQSAQDAIARGWSDYAYTCARHAVEWIRQAQREGEIKGFTWLLK